MLFPENPVVAVTHPNPYRYYRRLTKDCPVHRDATLGCLVVADASAVQEVLTDSNYRVRPIAEPVPVALMDTRAGDLFQRFARMTDGPRHVSARNAVLQTAAGIDPRALQAASQTLASQLLDAATSDDGGGRRLTRFPFALPVYALGTVLGIPDEQLAQTAEGLDDFVRCLAPGSSSEQIERGVAAADGLAGMMRATIQHQLANAASSPLAILARAAGANKEGPEIAIANGLGLLVQAYEATVGLIGNTVIALSRRPEVRRMIDAEPAALDQVIAEVLRFDPPVQNTRRWVATDGEIGGTPVKSGEMVLVLLAAANHDPAVNPDPERFDLFRTNRQTFVFGSGGHQCPGSEIAVTIATAGIRAVLASGVEFPDTGAPVRYRQSANTRIPLLAFPATGARSMGI